MQELEYLESVLQASVDKNGEKPLTNKHLLHIVQMAIRNAMRDNDDNYSYPSSLDKF